MKIIKRIVVNRKIIYEDSSLQQTRDCWWGKRDSRLAILPVTLVKLDLFRVIFTDLTSVDNLFRASDMPREERITAHYRNR